MSSRNEPERQALHLPQDPAALAAVVEPTASAREIHEDPSQVHFLSFLFRHMLLGSCTCSAFCFVFPPIRLSCHTIGAFRCLLCYSKLYSPLMFFIQALCFAQCVFADLWRFLFFESIRFFVVYSLAAWDANSF